MKGYHPYLITLRPTGPYYFGSEQNLSGGESYYAVSRQFPQQSTLLGALRYKLLEAHGLLAAHHGAKLHPDAKGLIGNTGFLHEAIMESRGYGVIGGITAVAIQDNEVFHWPGARDRGFHRNANGDRAFDEFRLQLKEGFPVLEGFDPKRYYPRFLTDRGQGVMELGDCFVEKSQVGIYKTKGARGNPARKPEADDDGFFKKTSYLMKSPTACFSLIAWLRKDAGDRLAKYSESANGLTPIGGEQSLFEIRVIDGSASLPVWEEQAAESLHKVPGQVRVVLMSDAYLKPKDAYLHSQFAMVSPVPFRFMSSSVDKTENYFDLDKHKAGKGRLKSRLFQLVEAGSVFYIAEDKLSDMERLLQAPRAYRQIGYNQYGVVREDGSTFINYFQPEA